MSDIKYDTSAFWKANVEQDDPELFESFRLEMDRQQNQIELIASGEHCQSRRDQRDGDGVQQQVR